MSEPFVWSKKPKYSAQDVRGLALGAFYQAMEWRLRNADTTSDDFDYKVAKFVNRRILKAAWSMTGHDDAMSTMQNLLDGMHAPEFDQVLTVVVAFRNSDPAQRQELLQRLAGEYGPGLARTADEFLAALDRPAMPQLLPRSTYAWDLSRMANLARRTVAAGWVTPQEVLPLLHEATNRSRQHFGGWPEYGASFVLGRALWNADEGVAEVDASLEETLPLLKILLTDPNSPWVRLLW